MQLKRRGTPQRHADGGPNKTRLHQPVVLARERVDAERLGIERHIMKPPDLESFLQIGTALKVSCHVGTRRHHKMSAPSKPTRIFLVEDNPGDVYLLEKALYELLYELNNRPAWLRIPVGGILSM